MERFHIIEDAAVVVRARGKYQQVKVYRRGDGLFAGVTGGFIRLYAGGGTSVPAISWDDIEVPVAGGRAFGKDHFRTNGTGALMLPPSAGLQAIEGSAR